MWLSPMFTLQIQSGLGKLILKEEMEREMTREKYTRSVAAQRFDSQYANCITGIKRQMYTKKLLLIFS